MILISNKNVIVDGLNNFFTIIGPDLAKNISNTSNKHFTDYLGTSVTESIFLSPVSHSELLNVVSKQKCKKSLDHHGLNMWIIKKIIISVLAPFMHICNLSFIKGIFPLQMKIATVIPMFKSGDKSQFNNYRPISVLSQFSKFWKIYFRKDKKHILKMKMRDF